MRRKTEQQREYARTRTRTRMCTRRRRDAPQACKTQLATQAVRSLTPVRPEQEPETPAPAPSAPEVPPPSAETEHPMHTRAHPHATPAPRCHRAPPRARDVVRRAPERCPLSFSLRGCALVTCHADGSETDSAFGSIEGALRCHLSQAPVRLCGDSRLLRGTRTATQAFFHSML